MEKYVFIVSMMTVFTVAYIASVVMHATTLMVTCTLGSLLVCAIMMPLFVIDSLGYGPNYFDDED